MSDRRTDSEQSGEENVVSAQSKKLAGSFSLREMEERERAHWAEMERIDRRANLIRMICAALLLIVVGGTLLSWRTLRSRAFSAEKALKRIGMELDFQKTLVFRQSPLNTDPSSQDAQTKRKLDDATADLESLDLGTQVRAIRVIESILAPRIPRAKAGMKSDYPELAVKYVRDLAGSQKSVTQRKNQYNAAAREYNREVARFPSNILHKLLGYPRQLTALR